MKQAHKSLYSQTVYQNSLNRINAIQATRKAEWGKMDSAQMFAHCSEVLEIMNGKTLKVDFMSRLFKPIIRKTIIGDKPYAMGGPTAPQLIIKTAKDFKVEKARLLTALETFYSMDKTKAQQIKHSFLGVLSLEERGWSMYKHLNHHLNQFGQLEHANQSITNKTSFA